MNITLISGTNRPGSNTRRIVSVLEKIYRDLGTPAEVLDLADLPAGLFLPSAYAEKPAAFSHFADKVLASGGLHIVTPEYNGSFPGVLKYFIDMLKFPESFEGRPVAFTGLAAGMWGALRSVEQLSAIFSYRNAFLHSERVFIPHVGMALSESGDLLDEALFERLRQQAKSFAAFASELPKKQA